LGPLLLFSEFSNRLVAQVNRFVNVSALKHYFNVTNSYVINKLFLVLFPWRHKPWTRRQATGGPGGQEAWYLPPRDDINSPDMYIPVMSLVTYIFLQALISGLRGQFQPELFGYIATTALVVVIVEILGLQLGCYLLSISNESQLLDLVAYSGYKFVGVIVTISIAQIVNGGKGTSGWVGWTLFIYTFLANSLFLVCLFPSMVSMGFILIAGVCARCGPSSMFSCRRITVTAGARCRRCILSTRGQRETNGRSSCFSIHTLCSCSSCGSSADRREGLELCVDGWHGMIFNPGLVVGWEVCKQNRGASIGLSQGILNRCIMLRYSEECLIPLE
jgi:hypothetical protein